jgi:hypothetical protein
MPALTALVMPIHNQFEFNVTGKEANCDAGSPARSNF